jgi:hypothetical protein
MGFDRKHAAVATVAFSATAEAMARGWNGRYDCSSARCVSGFLHNVKVFGVVLIAIFLVFILSALAVDLFKKFGRPLLSEAMVFARDFWEAVKKTIRGF